MLKRHRMIVRNVIAAVCDVCGVSQEVPDIESGAAALYEAGWIRVGTRIVCPKCAAAVAAAVDALKAEA